MKKIITAGLGLAVLTASSMAASLNDNPNYQRLKNFHPKGITSNTCLMCHKGRDAGIVADWQHSKHAKAGVGCVQCHVVPKNYPTALKSHPVSGNNWSVAVAVSSVTCAKCHAKEVTEFMNSGHARAGSQWLASNGGTHGYLMSKLAYNFEAQRGNTVGINGTDGKHMNAGIRKTLQSNQNTPRIADLSVANTCIQCHGGVVKLDKNGKPDAATWPSDGMAALYPDGGVSNCTSCHSRHKFSAAEARQPGACTNCHLGPDHPDKEVFESSVHGHIFTTNEEDYDFSTGKQIPGKTVRAGTCFTCHMSSINGLHSTHNVSARLKWNLWAPKSFERTKGIETAGWAWYKNRKIIRGNPKAGNIQGPEAARAQMKQVCATCHEATFTNNYFQRVDAQVTLYNQYRAVAEKMMKELKAKHLIDADAWSDPFFKLYYYMWHHEGRRMRHGAAMGSPDYSHWHGVFEVMQDIREMQDIYNYKLRMLKKYGSAKKALANEVPMPVVTHE